MALIRFTIFALALLSRAWLAGAAEAEEAGTPLATDAPEVRSAVRYMMTEMKRLSNRYRYTTLTNVHSASRTPANFDGHNLILDVEFDMLNGQLSRRQVILFHDDGGVITGMALDEFPDVGLRVRPDPDVN